MKRWTRTTVILTMGAALLFGACGSDDDSSSEPEILPAGEGVGDTSPADLLTEFAAGLIEVPADQNILVDPAACDMGRSTDDVYFAPTWSAEGDATVSCTMNTDQVLMLQPVGSYCIEAAGDAVDTACLDSYFTVTSSSVTVDGVETADLTAYQVDGAVETVALPDGNILEVPAGETSMNSRAYVALVDGLSTGDHVVSVAGEFSDGFAGSLTINLTVED